jgi:hypothetical protein
MKLKSVMMLLLFSSWRHALICSIFRLYFRRLGHAFGHKLNAALEMASMNFIQCIWIDLDVIRDDDDILLVAVSTSISYPPVSWASTKTVLLACCSEHGNEVGRRGKVAYVVDL